MYPGRLNLGVGVGEAVNEAMFYDGEWPGWGTRAGMLVEAIDLLRTLWDADDFVDFHGDHFSYDDLKLYTTPRSEIDIHWAGWGPQSCRAAGHHADHLITAAPPSLLEDQIVPNFEQGLQDAGRSLDDVDVTTEVAVNYGDPAELVAEIRERGEYIPDDTELDNPDPRSIQQVANEQLAAMSDEEIRDANTITDDATEIIETLERLEEVGVTRVLVGSNCGDPRETIDVFERDVIPHFD